MKDREYLAAAATVELLFEVIRWMSLDELLSRVRQERLAAPAIDPSLLARHGARLDALEKKVSALRLARERLWPGGVN